MVWKIVEWILCYFGHFNVYRWNYGIFALAFSLPRTPGAHEHHLMRQKIMNVFIRILLLHFESIDWREINWVVKLLKMHFIHYANISNNSINAANNNNHCCCNIAICFTFGCSFCPHVNAIYFLFCTISLFIAILSECIFRFLMFPCQLIQQLSHFIAISFLSVVLS